MFRRFRIYFLIFRFDLTLNSAICTFFVLLALCMSMTPKKYLNDYDVY